MFDHLQIYERRERSLVGCADVLLGAARAPVRFLAHTSAAAAPRRILLLRLERIGDLLMTMEALEAVRRRAPDASIHLVVGSWNEPVAGMLPSIDSYETLDASWLARHTAGNTPRALAQRAWAWRTRRFDLALNFEPDIRSNLLLSLSGAPKRVGFWSGGGGSLLTDALQYNPRAHTSANLVRLVDTALPAPSPEKGSPAPRLRVPEAAQARATELLRDAASASAVVGLHVSGGRSVKQWSLDRFAQVAAQVAREHAAALVFTGTTEDHPLVDRVVSQLPADVRATNLAGAMSLDVLAALLERLHLLITGDTGPMHLAAAVGLPIVAIFGASDPVRYAPAGQRTRVLTADLWCRPCNRIRRPPARCTAQPADCLTGVTVDAVVDAARDLLRSTR